MSGRFDQEFLGQKISQSAEKIWISGPPKMQAEIVKDLGSAKIDVCSVHFV